MAYSVTPPAQSYLASSPFTRAAPIPVKRVPTVPRGSSAGQAPVTSVQQKSNVTLPSDGTGSLLTERSDEFYRKFSSSVSGRRRSIASSPTVSSGGEGRPGLAPGSAAAPGVAVTPTVGFVAAASTAAPPALSAKAKPQRSGLLSKAFSTEPLAPQQELPSPRLPPIQADPLAQATLFFPGVDLALLRAAQEKHAVFKDEMVVTAYCLAARAHQFQLRKNGEPLVNHCMEVALLLAGMGLDTETVAAGLLHEVLAGDLYRSQLEEFMPPSVVSLIDRVSNISELSRVYREAANGSFGDEQYRRMLVAMEDVRAVLVKLADRVHNLRTVGALPPERQEAFARETLEVYSVVANRLGIWCLKAELEDLAFSVLHPKEFMWLKDAVRDRQDPAALEATINAIKGALQAHGVGYEDISGRPKSLYGIWSKLKKDGKPLSAESLAQVYDLIALRVVVGNKHDCYTALRAVQSVYRTMPERSKDFIKDIKKPNGYQSLHETVYGQGGIPVEVQIRTHKMHYIAEYGFAAHWKYKEALCSEDEWLEKETQYKRWLTQHKLRVHDKKVRPAGSPPTDSSLASLGVAYLDQPEAQQQLDPFLRHQRFKLQAPVKSEVSVLLQTQDTVEAREFPLGTTADQLWRELGLAALPGYAITVNSRLPASEMALQSGDLVSIVPLSQAVGRAAGSASLQFRQPRALTPQLAPQEDDDVLDVFGPMGRSSWALGPRGLASTAPLAVPGA